MNIRDSMKQQLIDLKDHLLETAALDVSQLGSEWEQRKEAIRRDAVFLDTFIIPDVATPTEGTRIATFVPPTRLPIEETIYGGEESSAGKPFLVPQT